MHSDRFFSVFASLWQKLENWMPNSDAAASPRLRFVPQDDSTNSNLKGPLFSDITGLRTLRVLNTCAQAAQADEFHCFLPQLLGRNCSQGSPGSAGSARQKGTHAPFSLKPVGAA